MKLWRNKKNQKIYKIVIGRVINATNNNAGQAMVLYKLYESYDTPHYVREEKEFLEKFEEIE